MLAHRLHLGEYASALCQGSFIVTSRPATRALAGLLSGLVVTGVVVALALTLFADAEVYTLPRGVGLGWLIPVIAAGLVVLLSWALLSPHHRHDEQSTPVMVLCSACDSVMMQEWRMCPYCGNIKSEGAIPNE